jgi:hypothetical protein
MLLWFDATQSLVYYMKSLTTSSSTEDGNATRQDLLITQHSYYESCTYKTR